MLTLMNTSNASALREIYMDQCILRSHPPALFPINNRKLKAFHFMEPAKHAHWPPPVPGTVTALIFFKRRGIKLNHQTLSERDPSMNNTKLEGR